MPDGCAPSGTAAPPAYPWDESKHCFKPAVQLDDVLCSLHCQGLGAWTRAHCVVSPGNAAYLLYTVGDNPLRVFGPGWAEPQNVSQGPCEAATAAAPKGGNPSSQPPSLPMCP